MGNASRSVLLVHGAWHGAWCWDLVATGLCDLGISASAIGLHRGGHAADVAATTDLLAALDGPVIACAHSLGGRVVTDLPAERLGGLVYIAASIPDSNDAESMTPPTTALREAMETSEDGFITVAPRAVRDLFYADCETSLAEMAISRLRPQASNSFAAPPPSFPAWKSVTSTYVVCDQDRAIAAEDQERAATRATSVVHWPTGHSPFLSRPDLVVALIAELASK